MGKRLYFMFTQVTVLHKNIKKLKIVKVHEEDYLYVIKHAGYNESFADTLRRLLKKNG